MMTPFPRMALGRNGQARLSKLFPDESRRASQRAAFARALQIADFVRDYSGTGKNSSKTISATSRRTSNTAYDLLRHSRVQSLHEVDSIQRSRLASQISARLATRTFSTRRFSTSPPPDPPKKTTPVPEGTSKTSKGTEEPNPDGILERLKKRVMRRSFLGKVILVVMLFRMSTTLEYYLLEAEASLYDTLKMFEVRKNYNNGTTIYYISTINRESITPDSIVSALVGL
jgi:hypothetical protein